MSAPKTCEDYAEASSYYFHSYEDMDRAEVTRLFAAAMAQARREALEEAALVAEDYPAHCGVHDKIANAIRALTK